MNDILEARPSTPTSRTAPKAGLRSVRRFWIGYFLMLAGIGMLGIGAFLIAGGPGVALGEIVMMVVAAFLLGAGARVLHGWRRTQYADRS